MRQPAVHLRHVFFAGMRGMLAMWTGLVLFVVTVSANEQDVWVVSTRHLGSTCAISESAAFAVEHLVDDDCGRKQWRSAPLSELLDDPSRPLVVFIHGNRYDTASAKQQGRLLAHRLSCFSTTPVGARTVVFSWPSQKQGCLLADGRTKYQRCYSDGHYLASFLSRVDPNQPIAVVVYSFGALITLEAFDDLCAIDGKPLPCNATSLACRPGPLHVVLVAPAVRSDALAPCGPYRDALACFDRLTLIINSRDEALRFFPLLDERVDTPALGYVGMPRRWVSTETAFRSVDATSIVGRRHSLTGYLDSSTLSAFIVSGVMTGL